MGPGRDLVHHHGVDAGLDSSPDPPIDALEGSRDGRGRFHTERQQHRGHTGALLERERGPEFTQLGDALDHQRLGADPGLPCLLRRLRRPVQPGHRLDPGEQVQEALAGYEFQQPPPLQAVPLEVILSAVDWSNLARLWACLRKKQADLAALSLEIRKAERQRE